MSSIIPLPELPLAQMSLDQKVRLRDQISESIWNHSEADGVGVQDWHEEVLRDRAEREERGELALLDVDDMFRRLLAAP